MTFDLTTLGEGQIRLNVPSGDRLSTARELRVFPACSEANVSGVLAQLGRSASWCTVLPAGDLAERCLAEYRSVGVDLSTVIRTPTGRMALYFLESGQHPMPARVTYDRVHTPFRDIDSELLDWDILLDSRIVFVTGITAALTRNTADVITEFVDRAIARGVDVALDVNYRSLLWSPESARAVLAPLAEAATILLCSRRDAATVFGIDGDGGDYAEKLRQRFDLTHVVSTDQTQAVHYAGEAGPREFGVNAVPVIDRPGAGDAFVAGVIDGYLGNDIHAGVETGMRLARFALTHFGDLTRVTPEELVLHSPTDIIR